MLTHSDSACSGSVGAHRSLTRWSRVYLGLFSWSLFSVNCVHSANPHCGWLPFASCPPQKLRDILRAARTKRTNRARAIGASQRWRQCDLGFRIRCALSALPRKWLRRRALSGAGPWHSTAQHSTAQHSTAAQQSGDAREQCACARSSGDYPLVSRLCSLDLLLKRLHLSQLGEDLRSSAGPGTKLSRCTVR